jgi:hypothetical protein
VNANTGTFGGATTSPQISVNGKGLITGVSAVTITPAFSSLTGKPTTLAGYGITDGQPLDGTLTAFAGVNWSAGTQIPVLTAADTFALKTVGASAGNILDKAAGDSLYQPTGAYLTANQNITLSGDASGSGTTAITVTIGSGAVTLAKMANLAANSIIGNNTGSAATPLALTAAQVKTLLAIAASDVSGLAAVATSGSASDLGSGTLPTARLASNQTQRTIQFVIDGGGAAITTGLKGYLIIPFACTITQATLLADQSGSVVVNVWKCTYAQFDAGATHPVSGDKITASAPPTISSAVKAQDATLTGWTTSVSAGDVLAFNVDSVATIQRVTLGLKVTAT